MLAEGNIKCICEDEEIYVYAHRYDFKLVNTHSQKLDFSKMECGRLLEVIASRKIRSIRQLASIYGRSRQWVYLYLEAMASVKVIGIDKSGYCVLDPQKIPMVGSIVIKGILGELRSKAEAELGDRFDQRPFHDTLLNMGSVPLPVMEREMTAWIAAFWSAVSSKPKSLANIS